MLGGEEGINNKNIMTYLGLIEQKTTTFLTIMYFMQLKVNITDENFMTPEVQQKYTYNKLYDSNFTGV